MELKTYLSKISQLTGLNKVLVTALSFSMITNIILSCLSIGAFIWSVDHHSTLVTPMAINKSFLISPSAVDASYLEQMALTFLAARFNVSPQNVDTNQQLILDETDSSMYHFVDDVLQGEAKVIKNNDMSSAFVLNAAPKISTQNLEVKVSGTLKKWVADRMLPDEKKTYLLTFTYQGGMLKLKDFEEEKNEEF